MIPAVFSAVLLFAAASGAGGSNQAIRLDPGDFRWWPIHVHKVPAEIDCRFEVLKGEATVHAELVPVDQFRAFVRHRAYDKLTGTADTSNGFFSQLVADRGDYAVVIINEKNAPPAIVSMYIETKLDPSGPGIARTLPPRRRLTVILISFAIFFVAIGWSGHKLIRAMKNAAP